MSRRANRAEGPFSTGNEDPDGSTERPADGRSTMLARTWAITGRYDDPADHGIPELPEWGVGRTGGRLSFLPEEGGEPFISAGNPVRARR
ncbi:hypothetical protein GRX01_14990 [Halobaculum sp. WSA2]|uniref:Uncharacterized protein n=1 Tax=Halobaculum saliterrae TaxID=2073113 RepID=A0A6B0SVI3_9EURY|nr:hypothetical protein [Halobaculum saliterrae]MXR42637.1 hypothetical protein [Halobaculum saliterrae]